MESNYISQSLTNSKIFGIEANSTIMDILSKKIYKDKEMAFVREIMCNAYDSHLEKGIVDTPIIVEVSEDNISFEDFGYGLDEEDIYNLYTTYGLSSKKLDNNFTGYMGIGSKSPFAYTDSFTVESCFNNVKKIFYIWKDSNNIPKCKKIGEVATDKTGLKVIVPIESFNHDNYVNRVLYVSYWFDKPVKVITSDKKVILTKNHTKDTILFEDDLIIIKDYDFDFLTSVQNFSPNNILVKYKNIIYQLDNVKHYKVYSDIVKLVNEIIHFDYYLNPKHCFIFELKDHNVSYDAGRETLTILNKQVLINYINFHSQKVNEKIKLILSSGKYLYDNIKNYSHLSSDSFHKLICDYKIYIKIINTDYKKSPIYDPYFSNLTEEISKTDLSSYKKPNNKFNNLYNKLYQLSIHSGNGYQIDNSFNYHSSKQDYNFCYNLSKLFGNLFVDINNFGESSFIKVLNNNYIIRYTTQKNNDHFLIIWYKPYTRLSFIKKKLQEAKLNFLEKYPTPSPRCSENYTHNTLNIFIIPDVIDNKNEFKSYIKNFYSYFDIDIDNCNDITFQETTVCNEDFLNKKNQKKDKQVSTKKTDKKEKPLYYDYTLNVNSIESFRSVSNFNYKLHSFDFSHLKDKITIVINPRHYSYTPNFSPEYILAISKISSITNYCHYLFKDCFYDSSFVFVSSCSDKTLKKLEEINPTKTFNIFRPLSYGLFPQLIAKDPISYSSYLTNDEEIVAFKNIFEISNYGENLIPAANRFYEIEKTLKTKDSKMFVYNLFNLATRYSTDFKRKSLPKDCFAGSYLNMINNEYFINLVKGE